VGEHDESDRTARWFASWEGEAGPGRTIRYRQEFEEGSPTGEMLIEACEAPRHLIVSTVDDDGPWGLEATLAEAGGVTTLTFVHHLDPEADAGSVGPGYYLDMLVASRDGTPRPDIDDYYPALKAHYDAQGA
jgi:hypothetical protein